ADVPWPQEALHAVPGRLEYGRDGRRYKNVRDQHREVPDPDRASARDGQRVRGRRRLEADREEHDFAVWMLLGQPYRVEGRVDYAHVGAGGFEPQEIGLRARHAEHVTERREDDAWPLRDRVRLVDLFEGRDADRASGTVDELDAGRQQPIDAVLDDRVRLPPADFHQSPRLRRHALDLGDDLGGDVTVTILVEILH